MLKYLFQLGLADLKYFPSFPSPAALKMNALIFNSVTHNLCFYFKCDINNST